eukprot:6355995-Alexandrium_andersonii.AAC.1
MMCRCLWRHTDAFANDDHSLDKRTAFQRSHSKGAMGEHCLPAGPLSGQLNCFPTGPLEGDA